LVAALEKLFIFHVSFVIYMNTMCITTAYQNIQEIKTIQQALMKISPIL